MLGSNKYMIEKSSIAFSFGQAAKKYDAFAVIQRTIADKLIKSIECVENPKRILDLGSGTGYCSKELQKKFPHSEIIKLDIAEGMLSFSNAKGQNSSVCADAESLPFAKGSFDLIVSSLTIQWCQNYSKLFSDLYRTLAKNGKAYLSTFGPDTLKELRLAWSSVDDYVHVNNFVSKEMLKKSIEENCFSEIKIDTETIINNYSTLKELSEELKAIGAHNMNQGQAKGLGGRQRILEVKKSFESGFVQGIGIPVTYETYYLVLSKAGQ